MLRSVEDAEAVGTLLVQALERENGRTRHGQAVAVGNTAAMA